MRRRRAIVIGGSVGGLLAANLLLRNGWEVAVFERTTGSLADRGAGIGTRDELFTVLRRAGADLDSAATVEVRARLGLDQDAAVVHEVTLRSVSTAWARVYRALRAVFPFPCCHEGRQLRHIEQSAASATAIFADGSRAHGDLLIGADGLHSTVRRQFLPAVQPHFAGYVSWRGVADYPIVPPALRAKIFNHLLFCFPEAGMLLTTPMPAPDEGRPPQCQFVWFRPAIYDEVLRLCTDAQGRRHGVSIPPPLIRPELVKELRASAGMMLPPPIAELVARIQQPRLQPIFDLASPRMTFGRVALLGDSAFVARPHVAAGVTKAALDAQSLADALADTVDVGAALTRYERERLPCGRALVARGRRIGDMLAWPACHERMAAVMRDYGAAGDLRPVS